MLRIIYMGTPHFAVPALEALIQGAAPGAVLPEGYELVTVITRPDKPVGRGKDIAFSPVKQTALAHGLPVWQPGSLKRPENIEALAVYSADLFIVAAFGQILPQAVLDLPRYGTLNIHASLLPKYRGVSPISEAILQGDTETGVTIMLIDAGVDTGPILLQRSVPIDEDETTASLTPKLAEAGAQALLEALPLWVLGTNPHRQRDFVSTASRSGGVQGEGKITPQPQAEQGVSHTHMLHKEDGEISWERPAAVIARAVRAYTPWPGAYTYWHSKLLKIISAHALSVEPDTFAASLSRTETKQSADQSLVGAPGTVSLQKEAGHEVLAIATGSGILLVDRLQLEGKKVLSAEEFVRGYPQIVGEVLGSAE